MEEKLTTARKNWVCDVCNEPITRGQKYKLLKGRGPRFDEKDNQCGIEYFVSRMCADTERCVDMFNYQQGLKKCTVCGKHTYDELMCECWECGFDTRTANNGLQPERNRSPQF